MDHQTKLTDSPEWLKNLILYEVPVKSFTSPDGPESGTFDSLKEKLPYLKELGITGIWLTGNSLSDKKHFYNIWTQYACVQPDILDPTLGSREAFKELIDTAHGLGIIVILDVITHGVMNESPLIREHPKWFKGGSWGMTDYDWYGGHQDLDDWWASIWLNYILDFGIDGFRLDVATYRQDLWCKIRKKASDAGHPIIIVPENGPAYTGVADFIQHGTRFNNHHEVFCPDAHRLLKDAAGYIKDAVCPEHAIYKVTVEYEDGTYSESHTFKEGALKVTFEGTDKEWVENPEDNTAYLSHTGILRVVNVCIGKKIANIIITNEEEYQWQTKVSTFADYSIQPEGQAPVLRLRFPLRHQAGQHVSIQLSCHDNGWIGYPEELSPYTAKGSRYVFGYGFMLVSAVPVFMAGEEFNADYVPLPALSPDLFGGENVGKGRWLYGSWIQWNQLEKEEKQAMLEDVRKLIRIRKQEQDLICPARTGEKPQGLISIECKSDKEIPVPYAYGNGLKWVLIAANPYTEREVQVQFNLTPEMLEVNGDEEVWLENLWEKSPGKAISIHEFNRLSWTIRRDKVPGGGLLVLKLERRLKVSN